mmetsp:Transcript_12551/g.23451  ORF Transcript_12551/g.23451 Transcript_12551/m.23451 type:complete len:207 (-) Transcript_12551:454-1074(-)
MRPHRVFVSGVMSSKFKTPATQHRPSTVVTANALVTSFPRSSVGTSGKLSKRSPLVLVLPSGHLTRLSRDVGKGVISRCKIPYCEMLRFLAARDITCAIILASCAAAAASIKAITDRLPAGTLLEFISSKRRIGSCRATITSFPERDESSSTLAHSPVNTASYWSLSSSAENADASCDCNDEPSATKPCCGEVMVSFSSDGWLVAA